MSDGRTTGHTACQATDSSLAGDFRRPPRFCVASPPRQVDKSQRRVANRPRRSPLFIVFRPQQIAQIPIRVGYFFAGLGGRECKEAQALGRIIFE